MKKRRKFENKNEQVLVSKSAHEIHCTHVKFCPWDTCMFHVVAFAVQKLVSMGLTVIKS